MNDIETVMWEAWDRVGPQLLEDRDELRARVARRRSRMFLRPLRAFCLAVRASDQRIDQRTAIITPAHALKPQSWLHPGCVTEHEVVVDARLCRAICAPVRIAWPGQPVAEVARLLGCEPGAVRRMIRAGTLRAREGRGVRGRPETVVYTEEALDPMATGRGGPDAVWRCLWQIAADRLPEGFAQTLTRTPMYWRACGGRVALRGWAWVCPGCGERTRVVYCPLRVPDWATYVNFTAEECDADAVPEPRWGFACGPCHGVQNFSRTAPDVYWNRLILHLSGGLMYGREVTRPAWLVAGRKRAVGTRRRAAPRRAELQRRLAETDETRAEIAAAMGITEPSVRRLALKIYKAERVKGRDGLRGRVAKKAAG